jgi:hypothetical protein
MGLSVLGTDSPPRGSRPYAARMSVNRVWLMGVVALAPRPASDELGGGQVSLVGVLHHGKTEVVDRFRVRSLDASFPPVGTEILVEGAVVTQGSRRVVLATRVAVLSEPGERTALGAPEGGTHAPPTPHQRRGHWRTLGRGTVRERLVWVRSTRVGQWQPPAHLPNR